MEILVVVMTGALRARAPPVGDFEFLLGQYTGNAVVDRLLCVAERAEEDEVAREALAHATNARSRARLMSFHSSP